MAKFAKNTKTSADVWAGMSIQPGTYYEIEEVEYLKWANDSKVLTDIGSGDLVIAKSNDGTSDIADVAEAITYLRESEVVVIQQSPQQAFSSKTTLDGKNLYKRIHGVSFTVSTNGTNSCDFVIPYPHVKIEGLEVINCNIGDDCSFKILDDATGTYSGYANAVLNQFAYGTYMSDKIYYQKSQYDADLYYGMVIRIEYNNTTSNKDIYVNYLLNEVK